MELALSAYVAKNRDNTSPSVQSIMEKWGSKVKKDPENFAPKTVTYESVRSFAAILSLESKMEYVELKKLLRPRFNITEQDVQQHGDYLLLNINTLEDIR